MHVKWIICLILALITEQSFTQKNYEFKGQMKDLNFYRYLQIRAATENDVEFLDVTSSSFKNRVDAYPDLKDSIKSRFIKCGMTILPNYSSLEFERKGYKKEETILCIVYMNPKGTENYTTEMAFINYKKEPVYYIRNSNFWGFNQTVKKILGAFENYTFQYDDFFSKKAAASNNNSNNLIGNIHPEIDTSIRNQKIPIEKIPVSDVDVNIPIGIQLHPYRFALIIGNEDYKSFQSNLNFEANVEFAKNDAVSFKEYAIKTMGVPEENVILLLNAGQVKMNTSISKMKLLAKISGGKAELIFYYAGHGLPDETSKEPYLIPVDVSGNNMSYAIKLKDVYKQLSEYPSERITIFLDACFSGGARDQALLAVRGVRIKPQEEAVSGRIIVFSASSGEQSASAYKEKTHGMFTYYLLKKMQETNGNVSYSELGNYINEKVSLKSVLVNEKEQNPQILFSPELQGKWESWTFN